MPDWSGWSAASPHPDPVRDRRAPRAIVIRKVRWGYTATRPTAAAPAPVATPLWSTAAGDAGESSAPANLKVDLGNAATVAEVRADDPAGWLDPGPEGEEVDPDTDVIEDPDPATVPEPSFTFLGEAAGDEVSRVEPAPRSGVFDSAFATATAATAASAASAASAAAAAYPVCQKRAGAWYYGRSERFMAAYAWSGAKAKVSQSYGVDHQLGIGMKGFSGKWSVDGTRKVDLNATNSKSGLVNVWAYNRVNYRDEVTWCDVWPSTVTRRLPISVHSLLTKFTKAKPVVFRDTRKCQTVTSGMDPTKVHGKNYTIGTGVDLPALNVSAQSGFNYSSSITFDVTKTSWLCGSSPEGWAASASQVVEAHKK